MTVVRLANVKARKSAGLISIVVIALVLAGCTSFPPGSDRGSAKDQSWAAPSATRPVVDLEFRVSDDLSSVNGTERVVFTPDRQVCEMVFRAWPNKPATADRGNSLTITSAQIDGAPAETRVTAAGAPESSPGTLVEIPLPNCVAAGTPITADLAFELQLGSRTDERVGRSRDGKLAWFGTAYPLLAWENGVGWARDHAVSVPGETVTSEVFRLDSLRVVAPTRYAVLGAGELVGTERDDASAMTTHTFQASAVRDVTVTVGDIKTVERRVAGSVVHVGAPVDRADSLDRLADAVADSVTRVSDYLGPVPDKDIWVSVIPDQTEGIEFPGAMQLGNLDPDKDRWLITHEVAHLWFYGLVGNNQALHPWLDESFASFVQRVVDDPQQDPRPSGAASRSSSAEVGWPMAQWDTYRHASSRYVAAVYTEGSDMLIQARRDVGEAAFDDALRGYLHANAYRIATPSDVEAAFAQLPAVITRMKDAGAL